MLGAKIQYEDVMVVMSRVGLVLNWVVALLYNLEFESASIDQGAMLN